MVKKNPCRRQGRQSWKKLAKQSLCMSPDQHLTMTAGWCEIGNVTMDVLPDDVLLLVFNCYIYKAYASYK